MKKPTISFFCPAYRDEENLPILIPHVMRVLKKHTSAFNILIVVDGDLVTKIVADSLARQYSKYITIVYHNQNQGYGAALKSGFRNAKKHEYVFYTDGDCQYDVAEISRLLDVREGADGVIGYRTKRVMSFPRQVQTVVYNVLIQLLFGLHVRDVNCSMKLIRCDVLNTIKLTSNSAFIDAELLILLKKSSKIIREVEVTHYPRHAGSANGGSPRVVFQTIVDMVQILKRHG